MRNRLLATVAVAAVVGFGGFAAAQSQTGGESNKATSGATSGTTQEKSGGSKFFLLATDYNWARITVDMVKKALPGLGATVVGEEFTPFNTTGIGESDRSHSMSFHDSEASCSAAKKSARSEPVLRPPGPLPPPGQSQQPS